MWRRRYITLVAEQWRWCFLLCTSPCFPRCRTHPQFGVRGCGCLIPTTNARLIICFSIQRAAWMAYLTSPSSAPYPLLQGPKRQRWVGRQQNHVSQEAVRFPQRRRPKPRDKPVRSCPSIRPERNEPRGEGRHASVVHCSCGYLSRAAHFPRSDTLVSALVPSSFVAITFIRPKAQRKHVGSIALPIYRFFVGSFRADARPPSYKPTATCNRSYVSFCL